MTPAEIDRVVVINLKRRRDRLRAFFTAIPNPWPFGHVHVATAVDGLEASPPRWYAQCERTIAEGVTVRRCGGDLGMAGAWGCLRSHLRVWEDALSDGVSSLLVFEDDALFCEEFAARATEFLAAVPDYWDQIYLGGEFLPAAPQPVPIGNGVLRCGNVNRTHAYAIRPSLMRAAYQKLSSPWSDANPQRYHLDHRLGAMHESGEWNVYAPTSWLVGQRASESDVCRGNGQADHWWQPEGTCS